MPPSGTSRRFLGILFDLTGRRVMEEELRVLHKNQAIGTLIAGLAHNFNNLLVGIVGPLDILGQRRLNAAETERWLEIARNAADQAALLVRELRALSSPGTAHLEPVDLGAVAAQAVDLVTSASDRRIEFRLEVEPGTPHGLASRSGCQQVLLNLLVNARDAVVERMAKDRRPAGAIEVVISPDAARRLVTVEVRDDGIGIPRELRDRVFDPFFTTKQPGEGSGLGLAMVSTIVRQAGGTTEVGSCPDGRTLVRASFPCAPDDLPDPATGPAADTPHLEGLRALVLDDEDSPRRYAEYVLTQAGMRVRAFGEASAALAAIEAEAPDIAVFDLNMPGMDGWEFLRRARTVAAACRFVLVTGYVPSDLVSRYRPEAVVYKPYHPDELVRAIQGALLPPDRSRD